MSSSSSFARAAGPPPARLLEIGRIERVHGLRGEVVVGLVTNMVDARTAPGAELWADDEPLRVASARPHRGKWLIGFDGVADRTAAEALRGRTLLAEPLDAVSGAGGHGAPETGEFATEVVAFVHELIGLTVIDQRGRAHGPVIAVVDNPAADLLELGDGRLVPLAFYRHHDAVAVTVDVPDGLLDDPELGG